MTFSIIVPIYNVEKYLRTCVESVLNQTYTDFELLLVDDGSVDLSAQICDEYALADARVRVVHKQNGGVVSARKAGAKLAIGDYVISVDSDDFIADNLLAEVDKAIKLYAPDMVCFGFARYFSENEVERHGIETEAGVYNGDDLLKIQDAILYDKSKKSINGGSVFNSLWTKAVKRELMAESQLAVPDTIVKGDDLAVTSQVLFSAKRVCFIDYCGYFYRCNPSSIMNTFNVDELDAYKRLFEFLDDNLPLRLKNNINVFILNVCCNYAAGAVRASCKYGEFKKIVNKKIDVALRGRCASAQIARPTIKDRIQKTVIKKRFWFVFWLLFRNKAKA